MFAEHFFTVRWYWEKQIKNLLNHYTVDPSITKKPIMDFVLKCLMCFNFKSNNDKRQTTICCWFGVCTHLLTAISTQWLYHYQHPPQSTSTRIRKRDIQIYLVACWASHYFWITLNLICNMSSIPSSHPSTKSYKKWGGKDSQSVTLSAANKNRKLCKKSWSILVFAMVPTQNPENKIN